LYLEFCKSDGTHTKELIRVYEINMMETQGVIGNDDYEAYEPGSEALAVSLPESPSKDTIIVNGTSMTAQSTISWLMAVDLPRFDLDQYIGNYTGSPYVDLISIPQNC